MWFRGSDRPTSPQADGDDGSHEPASRHESYPQLNSVQQDEAIYLLKHRLDRLERDLAALHKIVRKP